MNERHSPLTYVFPDGRVLLYPYGRWFPAYVADAESQARLERLYRRFVSVALAPLLLKYLVAGMFGPTTGWCCALALALVLMASWPVLVRRVAPALRRSPVHPARVDVFAAQARARSITALVALSAASLAVLALGAALIAWDGVTFASIGATLLGLAGVSQFGASLAIRLRATSASAR